MFSKQTLLEGLNQFNGANLVLNSDVDQVTFVKLQLKCLTCTCFETV